jgi:hypothetical protein
MESISFQHRWFSSSGLPLMTETCKVAKYCLYLLKFVTLVGILDFYALIRRNGQDIFYIEEVAHH